MPNLFDRRTGWSGAYPDTQMFASRMPAGYDTLFSTRRSPYANAFPQPDSLGIFPALTPEDIQRGYLLSGILGEHVGGWGDATHYTAPPPTKSTSAKPVASPSETRPNNRPVGPNKQPKGGGATWTDSSDDYYYNALSDQQINAMLNSGDNDIPRLNQEFTKRYGSHIVPHGPLGHVYHAVDNSIGTALRFYFDNFLNVGNMIANHPSRHTWYGSHEAPAGVMIDAYGNPTVVGPSSNSNTTKKPGVVGATTSRASATTGSKAGGTSVAGTPATAGTSAATGTVGAGGTVKAGGAGMPGSISALFDRVNSNLDAIQKRNDAEAAGYKTEADAAFKSMQDITNAPPPSIDPKNQMYTMLAANIAKALNPNIDAPGQAQQLIGTKLEGMREQNRQNYQMMAEKYRRASELFDKRGDHARAIELAKASDNLIKQAEMSMNESHFQAQMAMARDEKEQARLQRSFELDTSTLKSYAERLQELVQKTDDKNMKKRYQTRLTKTLRMLDKVTGTQLNSMGDPSKLTPVSPDSLYDELFATLDADHFPKNRAEMLTLFNKNKNFKDDALQNVWGFTRNEVIDYWMRKYGNNGGGM